MKWHWQRSLLIFAVLTIATYAAGCTAAWISTLSALVPAIATLVEAIAAFVAGLEGKTVSASFTATVNKVVADIQGELTNLQTLIASAKQAVTTSVVSAIQAVLQGIVANLQSILQDSSVTDPATVSKWTTLIGLGISAITAALGLIPAALAKLAANLPQADLEQDDAMAAKTTGNIHKNMQEGYALTVTSPSGSSVVDGVLATLPQELP
jgi:hypothetical protein